MKHLEVLDYLEQQYALPRELRKTLTPLLVVEHFQRKQIVYGPSFIAKKIWFVHSGHLCLYHFDGEVRITELYKAGSVILFCFTDEKKDSYLMVLSDCVVTTIDYQNLLPLLKNGLISPGVEKLILINEINRKIRMVRSVRLPAEDRVRHLMAEIPEIFLIATIEEIASYLKVSRETLRKIRNSG